MTLIHRDSTVIIEVKIHNLISVESTWEVPINLPSPINPNQGVRITLFDPESNPVVYQQSMINIDKGLYRYEYDVPSDAPLGVYTTEILARHASKETVSYFYGAFKVIE